VVMTSALHAEGREFNPRSEQLFDFQRRYVDSHQPTACLNW
jgi:hypothetical protein